MRLTAIIERWFDQWLRKRIEQEIDSRVDTLLQAWSDEHLATYFDVKFNERYDALAKVDLKELLDAYFESKADAFIEEKFDHRFYTWADTWADERLRPRLDEHFDRRFDEQIDIRVRARIANHIDDRIDHRIKQWIASIRTSQAEGQETAFGASQAVGNKPTQELRAPVNTDESAGAGSPATMLVSVSELEQYLRRAAIRDKRIREVLRQNSVRPVIPGRPGKYPLGEAVAWILLRKGKLPERQAVRRKGRRRGGGAKRARG